MAQNFRMIENDFYGKIVDELKALFAAKGFETYLETSAVNGFSFDLMIHLWGGPPALLIFLKQRHGRPDIAGFIKNNNGDKEIVMAEVKGIPLTLNDIYQLKKYVDLFNAAHAFLITSYPIPENIKRLIKFAPSSYPKPVQGFYVGPI